MESHNGVKLLMKVRDICQRAAAEGKTTVSAATLRQIDRQIRRMGHSHSKHQPDLFTA